MKTKLKPCELDAFGLWPSAASGIAGLGGADPAEPAPGYAFHTSYVRAAPGTATFTCRFEGLEATSGSLRIDLMRLEDATGRVRRRRKLLLPLDGIADGEPIAIRFAAGSDASYALDARLIGPTDARARGLRIEFDRATDGEAYSRRLDLARTSVFDRPSAIERSWLSRARPVEDAGLLTDKRATLADPVSQMCTSDQFDEPAFDHWVAALGAAKTRHRKLWEFVYVLQTLSRHGMLVPGSRGLGFGVGIEMLPALMAGMGCTVVATDLPAEREAALLWANTGQHADGLAKLANPALCPDDLFHERVTYRAVDMNAIPADLTDFDFCWSACAYEHLGSIEAGLEFFRRSLYCLRPGGVAVHTTEFNLTSDTDTVDNAATVLFRRQDIERLALDLHRAGHRVVPISYDQGSGELARHVDVPPYSNDVQFKIAMQKYVSTSFGLVVIRGPQA